MKFVIFTTSAGFAGAQAASVTAPITIPTVPSSADGCFGGITSFKACNGFVSKQKECLSKTSDSAQLDCLCTQALFSWVRECENEVRLCLLEDTYDTYFDQAMVQWHSYCDSRLPSVTTPPLASITTTWNPNDCAKYEKVCESAVYETNRCSTSVTAAVEFVSCVCRPKITSLYSSCWYDGGRKCAMENVQLEDIPGYSVCPGFQSGMTSHASSDLSMALSVFPFSSVDPALNDLATKTADPTSTAVPGTAAVTGKPAEGESTARLSSHGGVIVLYYGVFWAVWIV
ncbi:hypothetical protein QBC34DRAFT_414351 [Podospora aff. communis PSN243]|uniref:Extracellular membrane protein CFEM domain-containing protein n=1 Tax=Podospora aff. communis PSN243 TaxID=3040156 RepID=A0AAV9GBS9_9PEZI|nr:hypothetical protein QBC34DRAFT_414351 [Podospora aff. communis PSN243]